MIIDNPSQIEHLSQNRIVKVFREKLDYNYLGVWEERVNKSNIEEDELKKYLTKAGFAIFIVVPGKSLTAYAATYIPATTKYSV